MLPPFTPEDSVRLVGPILLLLTTCLFTPRAAASEHGAQTFLCCDSGSIQRVLEKYLNLHEALSNKSNKHPVSSRAHALSTALRTATRGGAGEAELIDDMNAMVVRVRDGNAKQIRTIFADLSRSMIALALRHEGGSIQVAQAECAAEGPWLQRDTKKPQSPWGHRCGGWN